MGILDPMALNGGQRPDGFETGPGRGGHRLERGVVRQHSSRRTDRGKDRAGEPVSIGFLLLKNLLYWGSCAIMIGLIYLVLRAIL